MIQKVNFSQDRVTSNHRVLSELVKKGVVVRYRHDWNKGLDYMQCNKFNIYYESFKSLQADMDLSRRFKRSNPVYNRYELEEVFTKAFYIIKMFNEDTYLNIFELYIDYVHNNTIFELDIPYVKSLVKKLDSEELDFNIIMEKFAKDRNWTKLTNVKTDDFLRDLSIDQKIFKNRLFLKEAVKQFGEGNVVTMKSLGVTGKTALWKNIRQLVDELHTFTEMPKKCDALERVSAYFSYFDSIDYKPSAGEVQSVYGGSRGLIKKAVMYYYEKDLNFYDVGAEDVMSKIQEKIDNPLDYNYELVKFEGDLRIVLTDKE